MTTIERLRLAGGFAVDLVYPRRCAGCGRRGTWLCGACDQDVSRFHAPVCARCGVPDSFLNCRCDALSDAIDQVRSVGPFTGWLRGAVILLKYHGEWDRAKHLAGPLVTALSELAPADCLAPVPLHPARLRQRGFNQALVLAEAVANLTGLEVSEPLVRSRKTISQVSLGAEDRKQNVYDAFSLRPNADVAGRSLILLDDVITTGATLAACASVLHEAGARSLSVATIAREID